MRYLAFLLSVLLLSSGCASVKKKEYQLFCEPNEKSDYFRAYDATLSLWNTPYEQHDVITSYGNAHVIISGPESGEPIVLFHGMDASATMWYPNAKALSKNYRVYAIDFPLEAGKSVACRSGLTDKQIVTFYNEIFDHFKLNHITLIGASRGGWMATNIALLSGKRIKKLVLLSPAQTIGGMKSPFKVLSAVKLKLMPNRKRLAHFFDTFSTHPEKISDHYKEQFYLANLYSDSKPQYIEMVRFSQKKLRTLDIPVLILAGDHDIVNDQKQLDGARDLFRNVETLMVQDAGHFLSIDQSAIVNQKILDFLDDKPNADHQLSSF
jgi:pimeloyl-ACP methyl ester carboxylesterase